MGYEFFGEKIIFPSALTLGINNDQSLKSNTKLYQKKITKSPKHPTSHTLRFPSGGVHSRAIRK